MVARSASRTAVTPHPERLRPWTEKADKALMMEWFEAALGVVESGELPTSFGTKVNETSAQGVSGIRVGVYKGMELIEAFIMAGFARLGPVWPSVLMKNIRYGNIGKTLEVLAALHRANNSRGGDTD